MSQASDAEERFRELTGAYAVVSDSNARLLYDRFGYRGRAHGFSADRRPPERAQVVAEVDLDEVEALRGARRSVRYSSREPCPACGGEGSVPRTHPAHCATCAGKGRLTRSSSLGIGDWLQVETCPDCDGAGFRTTPCRECDGSGTLARDEVLKLRIPAGVEDGARLRVVGGLEHEHLVVQVRPLPKDSLLVRLIATSLLVCALGLLAYLLTLH